MDDSEQLMPHVPALRPRRDRLADLPLNVSREILQQLARVEAIRRRLGEEGARLLDDLAENQNGEVRHVLEGVRPRVSRRASARIPRTASASRSCCASLRPTPTLDEQDVSLADYVSRMKEGQDKIYYLTADSFAAAKNSPHLEIFRKKGIEVLLMYDRVDEWVSAHLTEFEGKQLQSVAKGGLDLGKLADEEEKKQQEQEAGEYKALTDKIASALGERVKEVRVTHRLTSSPACLVADEYGMSMNLERLLKAAGQKVPQTKPIMEINPTHPMVQQLNTAEARFDDWSLLLFDQALLAEGGQLDDPAGFVKLLNELMLELAGGKSGQSN